VRRDPDLYRRQEFGWFLGALAGGMSSDPDDPSRAREGRHRVPDRAEQVRLRSTLGVVLRVERGNLTQQELADAAGVDRRTIDRLENGQRRPSTVSIWKIARALRPGDSQQDRVALDERLRQAAGRSLVWSNTRPHAGRERVRAELLAEAAGGPGRQRGRHARRPDPGGPRSRGRRSGHWRA